MLTESVQRASNSRCIFYIIFRHMVRLSRDQMSLGRIPMPPPELRALVGPTDEEDFDNPTGEPIYRDFGLPSEVYDSVLDFGCGCGRIARRLLLQSPRPRRYVGIDPHRGMVDWATKNLSVVDTAFGFFHHDVYSPGYAPENSLRLSEPFPVGDQEVSLCIAHSVFTHLCLPQTEYYLGELARILRQDGVAFTTWFFFDRDSFPMLRDGVFSLYTSASDFSQVVIYDRRWFMDMIRRLDLRVRSTTYPIVCGHQWTVILERRTADAPDRFPMGEEGAEWVCGASLKPRKMTDVTPEIMHKVNLSPIDGSPEPAVEVSSVVHRPEPPALCGALAQLERTRRSWTYDLESMRGSWTWKAGSALTAPAKAIKRLLHL